LFSQASIYSQKTFFHWSLVCILTGTTDVSQGSQVLISSLSYPLNVLECVANIICWYRPNPFLSNQNFQEVICR